MSRRERILAICTASMLTPLVLFGLVHRLVLRPARELARREQDLRIEKRRLESQNRALKRHRLTFAALRNRTFDDNPRRASVLVTERMNQIAAAAGLGEGDYTVSGFSERRLEDAGKELLCRVDGSGSLERVVNFLYLLEQESNLHKVTSLTLTAQSDKRRMNFSLGYCTPVLDQELPISGIPARDRPTTQPVAPASLNEPDRAAYQVIPRRHVFLPYVPAPAPPPPGPPPPPQESPPPQQTPPPQPPWYDRLVVTGLPSCNGTAEVHVAMPDGDAREPLKVGDRLGGGRITMIDYRVLPMPGNPKELSESRVILKIGRDYWAVELGQRLGQRRILKPAELPAALRSASAKPATVRDKPVAEASADQEGPANAADTKRTR